METEALVEGDPFDSSFKLTFPHYSSCKYTIILNTIYKFHNRLRHWYCFLFSTESIMLIISVKVSHIHSLSVFSLCLCILGSRWRGKMDPHPKNQTEIYGTEFSYVFELSNLIMIRKSILTQSKNYLNRK